MRKHVPVLLFFGGLFLGIGGTMLFHKPSYESAKQIRQGGYRWINPLLECEVGLASEKTELLDLENILKDKISTYQDRKVLAGASVYIRDLNGGPTFGINEKEEFSPASLLKLPILLAYYKQAEQDESLLNKTVQVEGEDNYNLQESFLSPHYLTQGKKYSIDQLLRAMIVSSDNNAMATLITGLPLHIQDQVYKDLGLKAPGAEDVQDFMTVKEYASFFRILYNASYLSKEYSEKALQLLSQVEFKDGIAAGVPASVPVAHKFGERTFDGSAKQLHDCGIVYLTDRPYLLCIMTRGEDYNNLTEAIEEIK